jgi:hypothetical protein
MATRSVTGLPDNDLDEATVSGHGPSTVVDPRGRELSYGETFAALNDVMARLRAKYPDQFKTQADDPQGLAARLWDQR